jgi:hypothetical protein
MDDHRAEQPDLAPLLDRAEARRYLGGISAQTLHRLVRDRELVIFKIRRRSFLRRVDREALVERSTRRTAL